MSRRSASIVAVCLLVCSTAAHAQDRLRVSIGGGQQTTTLLFEDSQTFEQYFETGSFKFERAIPKRPFFDAGVAVRIIGGLHAGMTLSVLDDKSNGTLTAQEPHPLLFNQMRTTTGDVTNTTRKETAAHVQISWTAPAAGGLEFTFFAGPSIFVTEQSYVTKLDVTIEKEVYPFDTLSFPGVTTETLKDNIKGYNAGVDLTWRFSHHIGVGMVIRYSNGKENFTPTGGAPFAVEVGGLHAGGGLRLIF